MKPKISLLTVLLLGFLISSSLNAQQRTITGTITDENNLPLPGVNILVQNTSIGTQSDFDGNYSITANPGDVISFSYLGYLTQSNTVTAATNRINIKMQIDESELEEVVITALGIRKEKKALGYAVTALSSEDIEQRATGDITKILKGKAAGVDIISTSGLSGSASSINIRGLISTGNNQPLFVVDGVPFNSVTNSNGVSGTSRSLDIDPNNIESVNVLKGLSATALYGSDGRNGVILITTKAGTSKFMNKKNEITITASTFVNNIANLPDFTNSRGQGYYNAYYNFFGNWGATFGVWNYGNIGPDGTIEHPYSVNSPVFRDGFPHLEGTRVAYKDYRSQENFFYTGIIKNISISASGGGENFSYAASVGNMEDEGFMPENTYRRTVISVGGAGKLSNKFTVSGTLNLTSSKFKSPFTEPIFQGLYNTPKSIDLAGWPYQHPVTGEEIGFQTGDQARNPYWIINNTFIEENVGRGFGQINLNYEISEKLNLNYRYGIDISNEEWFGLINRGSNTPDNLGGIQTITRRQIIKNHTLMVNYDNRFGNEENFGLSVNLGADVNRRENHFTNLYSEDQSLYGVNEHHLFSTHTSESGENAINRPGLFAQFTLDYKNYLFLTGSARNDWTSNFIDNSQFYPGLGISFIPTEAIEGMKGEGLNYLKLRAGYGSSANFDIPGGIAYPTFQLISGDASAFNNGSNFFNTHTVDNYLANGALGPALISEYEFGIETRFIKNRVTLDASYYNRVTNNLIFERELDPATGYTNSPRNVNEFKNNGIEIELNITALQNDNFSWDIGGNFTKSTSEVTQLEEERFAFTAFATPAGPVGNYLVEGEPVGLLMGPVIATNEQGQFLVDDGGNYIIDEELGVLGDPNPDFISSFFTAIRYKNVTLTANLQYRHGGDVYINSSRSLIGRGLTKYSDGNNNQGVVLPGVFASTGEENNILISSGDSYFNNYSNGSAQFGMFDGSVIRLQEVALTYQFDPKALENGPFGNLSISIVGENLYFKAINIPDALNIDPQSIGTGVNSNGMGIEGGANPTSRRIGLSVKTTF